MDEDDTEMYVDAENYLARNLIEDEDREPSFTGLLSAKGKPIFRLHPPKPKFGFPLYDEDNEGYDFDTENDFIYVELNP